VEGEGKAEALPDAEEEPDPEVEVPVVLEPDVETAVVKPDVVAVAPVPVAVVPEAVAVEAITVDQREFKGLRYYTAQSDFLGVLTNVVAVALADIGEEGQGGLSLRATVVRQF
jgi:hypothetical protein